MQNSCIFFSDKVLKELIESYDRRVQGLQEFLNDVKPSLKYEIVPLSDPFGPSISDPELQCIVVSEETRRGGEAVNKKRVQNVRTSSLDFYLLLLHHRTITVIQSSTEFLFSLF